MQHTRLKTLLNFTKNDMLIYLRSSNTHDYYYDTVLCKYVWFSKFEVQSRIYYDFSTQSWVKSAIHHSRRGVTSMGYIYFTSDELRNHITTLENVLLEKILNNI